MRACIYNPYLDSLGGGERYTSSVASVLVKAGYKVDIAWKYKAIKDQLESRFGIDLSKVKIVKDINRGDLYDVCFWVSDGSIPMLRARKNFLHFQIPFQGVYEKTLISRIKFYRINKVVCNSEFTKKIIDREYDVDSVVVYPPVDTKSIKPKRKENLIVYIGRFSKLTQAKKQDVLVKSFKKLYDSKMSPRIKSWKLVLAGGVEIGEGGFVKKLREMSEGYPVRVIRSPSFQELVDLYGRAKIFWSASGYKVNEEKKPKKVEHFGITVVEAMAAGAVPVIYSAGGHKEIIEHGVNGYLWKDKKDLLSYTAGLTDDFSQWKRMSSKAKSHSKKYSHERFKKEFLSLL